MNRYAIIVLVRKYIHCVAGDYSKREGARETELHGQFGGKCDHHVHYTPPACDSYSC